MLSSQTVALQVARMNGLDKYPRKPEGLRAIAEAFRSQYHTEEQLAGAIARILQTRPDCPKPCELYAETGVREQRPKRSECSACDGTGFVVHKELRTPEGWNKPREFNMAYLCSRCRTNAN